MSAPVNGKKLAFVASTGLIGNTTWLDTEVKNLASQNDGIEIHDYLYHTSDIPCVGFSDAQYYNIVNAANKGQIGPRIDQTIGILDKYDPAETKLGYFITCPWCVSIYMGAAVAVARELAPGPWKVAARALAFSAFTGLVASHT